MRTVTRLVWELHEKLPRGLKGFTDRTRSARRRMQAIQRMTARQREQQQTPQYRERVRKVDETTRAVIDAICK